MSDSSQPAVVPSLRYRKALEAIEWLCNVFGFERAMVVADGDIVHHAQLTLGRGMIMLGSVVDSPFGRLMKQPDEIGGFQTQSIYLVVPDADAVHARAKAAGAAVVIELQDRDYGGRDFSCRDLEGHLWTIGAYDPWRT